MSHVTIEFHPHAHKVQCTETSLIVELVGGRTVTAPLIWFPRLSKASVELLQKWELLGDGEGIHWPEIDEDLSVAGLLAGIPNIQQNVGFILDRISQCQICSNHHQNERRFITHFG